MSKEQIDELDTGEAAPPSKTFRNIKRLFKILLYGSSFLVYSIIFFLIFTTCDPSGISDTRLSESAQQLWSADPDNFMLYWLKPTTFMNDDGSVQIKDVIYAETAGEVEATVMLNLKKIAGGDLGSVVCLFTDDDGNFYPAVSRFTDTNRTYGYIRISFSGVKIDFTDNYYQKYAYETFSGDKPELKDYPAGGAYKLKLYRYSDLADKGYLTVKDGITNIDGALLAADEDAPYPLASIDIYDNRTAFAEN